MWPKIICILFLINVWSIFHALSCFIEKWWKYTVHRTGLKVSEQDWNYDLIPDTITDTLKFFPILSLMLKNSILYFSDTILLVTALEGTFAHSAVRLKDLTCTLFRPCMYRAYFSRTCLFFFFHFRQPCSLLTVCTHEGSDFRPCPPRFSSSWSSVFINQQKDMYPRMNNTRLFRTLQARRVWSS